MDMDSPASPWNSLEIARLVVGILTPLTLAVVGLLVNRYLKRLDMVQWKNQKLLEKRIAIYDLVAPQLNLLLCFYTWVGYWKSISPEAVIQAKRDLDKTMNVYRYAFPDEVYGAYQDYIQLLFQAYTGVGHDAKILSTVKGIDGDRSTDAAYEWKPEWNARFLPDGPVATRREVRERYGHLMGLLTTSFGVEHDGKAGTPDDAGLRAGA